MHIGGGGGGEGGGGNLLYRLKKFGHKMQSNTKIEDPLDFLTTPIIPLPLKRIRKRLCIYGFDAQILFWFHFAPFLKLELKLYFSALSQFWNNKFVVKNCNIVCQIYRKYLKWKTTWYLQFKNIQAFLHWFSYEIEQ